MSAKYETMKHIRIVQTFLCEVMKELLRRSVRHDDTKLNPPEEEIFEIYTDKLKNCTYGSDEYKQYLAEMKPALDHHYKCNRHHPEHFPIGIKGMNLIDLIEMLCDWTAASMRHADGDIWNSIEINQKRFGYSDELKQILLNTVDALNLE